MSFGPPSKACIIDKILKDNPMHEIFINTKSQRMVLTTWIIRTSERVVVDDVFLSK